MTLDISVPEQQEIFLSTPKITVIGVGGAGGNAINNMIHTQLGGVNFVVSNTDAQALGSSLAETKIQLGIEATKGQGAGANPEVGRESAEEAVDDISNILEGSNMVFITAGMGGGTGTGAAPVFAKMARDRGILTVGVVTKPFMFEGRHRMAIAERGIEELAQHVDTLIVIPNQNLFLVADDKMTFAEAFKKADQVLQDGVRSVTDLIITPGIINLDFSDVRTVMSDMGRAMMGTGLSSAGEDRALIAAEEAISNPLLDDSSMAGARGILINIAGGSDLTLFEVDAAANKIRKEVDPEANIIFGASYDEALEGSIRVSIVATGIARANDAQNLFMAKPSSSSLFTPTTQSKTYPTTFNKPSLKKSAETTPMAPTTPEENKEVLPPPMTPQNIALKPSETQSSLNIEKQDNLSEIESPVFDTDEDDIFKMEEVESPTPSLRTQAPSLTQTTPSPYAPKTTSSVLPAMPSANELFGGETRQPVAFESFTPKMPEHKAQESFEIKDTHEPTPFVASPQVLPQPQPIKTAQEDLFAPPPPPSLPPAVKPSEKTRHSLFQFVTGRRAAEIEKENQEQAESVEEDESDLPAFLRQK